MDSLFDNIKLYCGILQKCSLPEVSKWRKEDLDRALHWANYFDKALIRIKKRKSVIAKVDAKLREFGQTLGGRELNFESFQQSSQYLIKTLLGNPHLSKELKGRLLDQSKPAGEELQPTVKKVKCEDATVTLQDRQSAERKAERLTSEQQLLSVPRDTFSLLESIHTIQRDTTPHAICQQFDLLSRKNGTMAIILNSLVENIPSRFDNARKAVLHWIINRARHPEYRPLIWKQSPELLAKISSWYLDFFTEHLQYIVTEAEKLECISAEFIKNQKDTSQAENVDQVASHFIALSRTNEEVREVCFLFLKSRAQKHLTRRRFSYSSPLALCVWARLLSCLTN